MSVSLQATPRSLGSAWPLLGLENVRIAYLYRSSACGKRPATRTANRDLARSNTHQPKTNGRSFFVQVPAVKKNRTNCYRDVDIVAFGNNHLARTIVSGHDRNRHIHVWQRARTQHQTSTRADPQARNSAPARPLSAEEACLTYDAINQVQPGFA